MKLYVSIIKISEEQVLQMEMNNNSIAGAITFDVPLAGIRRLRLIVIDRHLFFVNVTTAQPLFSIQAV